MLSIIPCGSNLVNLEFAPKHLGVIGFIDGFECKSLKLENLDLGELIDGLMFRFGQGMLWEIFPVKYQVWC